MIKVPMYQARIPIGGGGGHIDLREEAGTNPIAQVLKEISERKRQTGIDDLNRRMAEAEIAKMQQPDKGRLLKMADGSWSLVDSGGNVLKTIPAPPESGVKVLEEIAKVNRAAESTPEGVLPTSTVNRTLRPLQDEAMLTGQTGVREALTGLSAPPPKEHAAWHEPRKGVTGIPEVTKPPIRKKVKSKKVGSKVNMKAPDGKTYEVPKSEVEEAKKHGWKVL